MQVKERTWEYHFRKGCSAAKTLGCGPHLASPTPPCLPSTEPSSLESDLVQQASSYLGLNTLIKLVIFEAKSILVPLRPGTSHVPFL